MPVPLPPTKPAADLNNDTDPLLSNDTINTLTDINDIRHCLRLLDQEETNVDHALDQLLSQQDTLQAVLASLDILRPQLAELQDDSTQMMETIQSTAKLAINISDKVRQLDKEQTRTRQAISYVDDVQELRRCIAGIQHAMARREYDDAANFLEKASRIDRAILHGSLAEFTVPTSDHPDHPVKTLADAKHTLFDIFSQRFDDAVAQRNEADITRYFKLFPLIGCSNEGLDKYSRFVCNIVKDRCAEELKMSIAAPLHFAEMLTRLFENIAVIIDKHQPLVEANYGRGKMLRVIQQLQQESDTQSGAVLDRFFESRNIEAKLSEIQSLNVTMVRNHRHLNSSSASSTNAGFASPTLAAATLSSASPSGSPNPNANAATASAAATIASTANHPLVGPRQLDANLLEMSLVCQRASLFQGFLHDRADEEMDKLQASKNESAKDDLPDDVDFANKDQRYYSKNSLLLSSGLSKRLIELTNAFLVIDDYLLRTSMDKAIALDDYDASSSQTSTCVDDVFYILKKVIKRSMATYQPDLVASTVQATLKALDNGYLQVFQQRLGSAFTSQDVASRSDRSMEQSKVNYMVTLNNLDASSEYTHRLTDEMKKEATKAMWQNEDDDRRAVMDSLDKFEAVATKFDQLLHTGMEQLLGQILKPRLRPLFQEAYRDVKYVLEEEEYNEAELDELFVKRFQHGFDGMVQLYRKTLTPSNWSSLMGILLDVMTTQWERIVMQTRFNQYGALRFDKDLRAIIQHLSNMTEWFSRDKFTRLNQMATVLCFEEPSEIYHYWGAKAGLSSWRLTVTEVKKILSLRLDFDADQVNNLSL